MSGSSELWSAISNISQTKREMCSSNGGNFLSALFSIKARTESLFRLTSLQPFQNMYMFYKPCGFLMFIEEI